MRILVSGAAGFLGSHLTDLLLSQGHTVVGADNFITGKPANVAHLEGEKRFTLVRHDVIEPLKVDGPIDRVYHMASPASPIGYVKHQVATLKVNSAGTWNLLELAESKSARFLMASTSETYGDPTVNPQREEIHPGFGRVKNQASAIKTLFGIRTLSYGQESFVSKIDLLSSESQREKALLSREV